MLRDGGFQPNLFADSYEVDPKLVRSINHEGFFFINFLETVFPVEDIPGDFLEARPDFYLGRLFSMFPNLVSLSDLGINSSPANETEPFHRALTSMLKNKLLVLTVLGSGGSCLSRLGENLLPEHYDVILDILKHSQLGNTTPTEEDRKQFFEKYVDKSYFLSSMKKAQPQYLENDLKFLTFCGTQPGSWLTKVTEWDPSSCEGFEPTVTGKGLCFTFNGLPMKDVFKKSPVMDKWSEVFQPKQDVPAEHPTGYGPSNGLNIVLNMFKPFSADGDGRNSILSISNQREWVNIISNNYQIQPGFSYTFKVTASQMVTTARFDGMSENDRNCRLPHETQGLDLMKEYSKGGCQYECTIKEIIKHCNCTNWNIPKLSLSDPPFCEKNYDVKSAQATACSEIGTPESTLDHHSLNCNCPSSCTDTSFTIFDIKQPLSDPGLNCEKFKANQKRKEVYPFTVFCDICRKASVFYRIYFHFNHLAKNSPDPENFPAFCNQFLMNNVATVKVEMASASLTRSVRDERFNFESQLSSLGEDLRLCV